MDLADPDCCFQITPTGSTQAVMALDPDVDSKKRPHAASVIINSGEQATFDATFKPKASQRSQVIPQWNQRSNAAILPIFVLCIRQRKGKIQQEVSIG